jgi:hypothetical protein
MGWFSDLLKKLRPEAILDITKGGEKAKKMKERIGHSMASAGTGYLVGGPIGGIAGGIWGYNEGKEPLNFRNLGQNALRGVAAGGVARGGQALISRLGSVGSAGSTGSTGTTGVSGTSGTSGTSTASKASNVKNYIDKIRSINNLMNNFGESLQTDDYNYNQEQLMYQQWLNDMRKKRDQRLQAYINKRK